MTKRRQDKREINTTLRKRTQIPSKRRRGEDSSRVKGGTAAGRWTNDLSAEEEIEEHEAPAIPE